MIPTVTNATPAQTPTAAVPATKHTANRPLRIGFWGTQSHFSQIVLATLLRHHPVTLVALPADAPDATVAVRPLPPPTVAVDEVLLVNNASSPNPLQTAWQHHLAAYTVQQRPAKSVAQWLADQALDIVCVACFPWRIPATLLAVPTYGFLNLHPSLLPAYRGPAPLFWQLRAGGQTSGVTVHWMDADFDTGALAAQTAVTFPEGATSAELDALCATAGAELLCHVLGQLGQGLLVRQPQPAGGSYQPWPTSGDFRLEPQWSARHAYNFMCGTAAWHQPYPLIMEGEELLLRCALTYEADALLARPLLYKGREVLLQLRPGVLRALLW